MTFSDEEDADAIVPDSGSLRFASSAETIGTVVRDPMNASDLHDALFGIDAPLQDALFAAAEELAADVDGDRVAFAERLNSIRDPEMDPSVGGAFSEELIAGLSGENRFRVRKLLAQLGSNTYLGVRTSFEEVYAGPMAVLRAADVTPTIVVTLSAKLFDTNAVRRDTRETLLEYVTELGRACDVRLVASGLVQIRLIQEHRELLPTGVIETAPTRLRDAAGVVDGDDVVASALATIDYTDSAWNVLRVICEGRSDSARYAALRSDSRLDFGRSRLSQCLSTLVEADLVFTEGPQNDKYAIATPAGTAALEALESEIGRQSGLGDFENEGVSNTLQSKVDPCSDAQARGGGDPDPDQPRNGTEGTADGDRPAGAEAATTDQPAESGGRSHSSGFAPVETLTHWEHHAAVASAPNGGVGVDDVPLGGVNNAAFEEWTITRQEDNRSPIYSYNESRDELVVGADWHGPLQYTVSVARALLSPLAFDQILTPERLDGNGDDLDALLNGVKGDLRDKRCLGYLKQAYSGKKYVEALERGIEDLKTLTANIENGDFTEEQRDLRSETMKLAHGLIGTATGIYDLLGVDVTRILRLPGRVTSDMKAGGRKDLQQCLVRMATIASKMGLYTQSRVQFEPRDEKRNAIGKAPLVDAADPTGTHIGQWSIQGYGATDLTDDIEYALENPGEFDLPMQVESEHYADFVVDLPIEASFTRERVATATARILGERSMRMTRQAVSVMQAFTGSIHDVAKALFFKSGEDGRHVRVDDLKYALSTLPKSRIIPQRGSKGTKSAILHTLLSTSRPLSQRELCERAGVATATFAGHGDKRSHRDELAAFDLIRETESGWVVCLTYREAEFNADAPGERPDALPFYAAVDDESSYRDRVADADGREDSLRGAVYEAAVALEPMDALGDPDHPVIGATYGAFDRNRLRGVADVRPEWRALLNAACAFVGDDPLGIGDDPHPLTTVATLGREPEQAPITSGTQDQAATASD